MIELVHWTVWRLIDVPSVWIAGASSPMYWHFFHSMLRFCTTSRATVAFRVPCQSSIAIQSSLVACSHFSWSFCRCQATAWLERCLDCATSKTALPIWQPSSRIDPRGLSLSFIFWLTCVAFFTSLRYFLKRSKFLGKALGDPVSRFAAISEIFARWNVSLEPQPLLRWL